MMTTGAGDNYASLRNVDYLHPGFGISGSLLQISGYMHNLLSLDENSTIRAVEGGTVDVKVNPDIPIWFVTLHLKGFKPFIFCAMVAYFLIGTSARLCYRVKEKWRPSGFFLLTFRRSPGQRMRDNC